MKDQEIKHIGVVHNVSPYSLTVRIEPQSACSACHAKSVCGSSNGEKREIEVLRKDDGTYKAGDSVNVTIRESMGWRAVAIAYLIPLAILLVLLLTLSSIFSSEPLVGVIIMAFLLLYYLLLALMRKRIGAKFIFTVEKR